MQKYKVNEIFYSLQGEGHWAGRAAIFIRFSMCNVHCPFCDTDFSKFEEMTATDIVEKIQEYPQCKFIVLTGGEPTLQVTEQLLQLLHSNGSYVAMETNGTNPIPNGVDWVTCSPKTSFVQHGGEVKIKKADEIKVVFDGVHEVNTYGIEAKELYVQPCDTGKTQENEIIIKKAVQFIKDNPKWELSLQLHKIINIK